jgi:aspartyl-tRNA(Asn)/glutamyl-tRNA(Gln) amidotransferase subunit B
MEFESVIGLEVHAQLSTKTKLWCGCKTSYNAIANTHTCPVCLGLPGVLPLLNKTVVDYAIRLGLALNAKINTYSEFSRKNYFYQDLPLGYQITQFEIPIIEEGVVHADVGEVGEEKYPLSVGLERAHIENDTGKTIHDDAITGADRSFVDFNRAGTPLLEIVTRPDLRSGKEAVAYVQRLRQILRFLDICDGNMEEGSLRCDANVSIRPKGDSKLGVKVEVKNMNSFKNVEKAINFEIERQKALFLAGEKISQETRMWDAVENATKAMRSKEDSMDYRYFPEPDLIPLKISQAHIEKIRSEMPELPDVRRDRFVREFNIPIDDANTLTSSIEIADYYEAVIKVCPEYKLAANWVLTEALRVVNEQAILISEFQIEPTRLGQLIELIKDETISGKIAKGIFEDMLNSDKSPKAIVEEKGLVQITDLASLEPICKAVVENNPQMVEQYRLGKDKLFGFFVGQVMKQTAGKANPTIVNELIKKYL